VAGLAFVEAMVDGHLIHQSVVDEWKNKLLPLEYWTAKFVIVTSAAAAEGPASTAAMEVHKVFFNTIK
jgi:tRNA(His) 5'-end guanylyltransferase